MKVRLFLLWCLCAVLLAACSNYPRFDYYGKGGKQRGIASWYGPGFHGKKTANGETYDQEALTAAHRYLAFNRVVRVTNLRNGKSVVVRINDRGPFVDERIIDLSHRAAVEIDMIGNGTAMVEVEILK